MSKIDEIEKAVIKTADYLYTIKGDDGLLVNCSPELYQAISKLRQLINEGFNPQKSVNNQFIYDIISPAITKPTPVEEQV